MEDSYRSYTFSLGENPKRVYTGMRAPVSQGQTFAFEVIDKWKMLFFSFIADAQKQSQNKKLTAAEEKALEMQFILKMCCDVDIKEVMAQGEKIVTNQVTQVIASEENKPQSYALSDSKQFDNWFEKYPQDLMQVYGHVVWNNVQPFISSFMQTWAALARMEEMRNPMQDATPPVATPVATPEMKA